MLGFTSIYPLNPIAEVKAPVDRILVSINLMAQLEEQTSEKAQLLAKSEKSRG